MICHIVGIYFSNRLKFPSRLSIAEFLRKRYGDWTLKLIRKFEKTNIKHKKTLLDFQLLKICDHKVALLPHIADVEENFYLREEIYSKKPVVSKLHKEYKLLYNSVKSVLNLLTFIMFTNI